MRNEDLLFTKLLQITNMLDKSLTKQCCTGTNGKSLVLQNNRIILLLESIAAHTAPGLPGGYVTFVPIIPA